MTKRGPTRATWTSPGRRTGPPSPLPPSFPTNCSRPGPARPGPARPGPARPGRCRRRPGWGDVRSPSAPGLVLGDALLDAHLRLVLRDPGIELVLDVRVGVQPGGEVGRRVRLAQVDLAVDQPG